uniref:LAM_G_DOMAIN domain-containing protein n=1 Tax=Macrostomum lignano TaxID=282301 RepID=A0A1I8JA72_9PLAT
METVHQQQGSNRRSRHQQRLSSMPTQATQRQQSQPAKRSYLSKLQIACILFAAFAYRLASEHQSDWELVPTAYFDLDGEANADFVAKQFLLTPVPAQFNSANKLKGEHGKQPELNEMAWISHAGDGWLVGLDRQPLKTSLRTLASWPHRVLAQLPDIGADAGMGRMPLAIETATVGKQLALRLGDSIDLYDPSSGVRLHRLLLDGRPGAYDIVDSRDDRAIRVGLGPNCTAEAASVEDRPDRVRRFENLCESVEESTTAGLTPAVPLLLPTPPGQQGGWRDLLGHLLGERILFYGKDLR